VTGGEAKTAKIQRGRKITQTRNKNKVGGREKRELSGGESKRRWTGRGARKRSKKAKLAKSPYHCPMGVVEKLEGKP